MPPNRCHCIDSEKTRLGNPPRVKNFDGWYYSTNNSAYYGRLKFGMAFAERVYVGPEVVALGDNFFQQFRVGGHLSGLQFGAIQMGVSAGFLADRVRGAGVYGILESRVTF